MLRWNPASPPRSVNSLPINHVGWLGDHCTASLVAGGTIVNGEVGHAFVAADRETLDVDELRAFARRRLANYKVPKRIDVVAELPRLPIGKIDRRALAQTARELAGLGV